MYTIAVEKTFTASHQIAFPDGSREAVHSHDWHVTVGVSSEQLNQTGLAMDFRQLNDIIEGVTVRMAGCKLEQVEAFANQNASAENVARHIYNKVELMLPSHVEMLYVKVTESPGCSVKYTK
ncbi:MAG: 6-carboxytetrahydropterin synthase [Planctomycetota bacterium]